MELYLNAVKEARPFTPFGIEKGETENSKRIFHSVFYFNAVLTEKPGET